MARTLSVAVKSYPHTAFLTDPGFTAGGHPVAVEAADPIYRAFAPMVRELRYDASELALATFLQAREAGVAISLLPVVLSGDFHHHSLTRWPGSAELEPADLAGRKVGVRAYSQTSGLWVRGILHEEFGIDAKDVTWVTTEGPHVAEYVEPPNVERTHGKLLEVLERGEVGAAVLGPPALDGAQGPLVPIIPRWREAEEAWGVRHATVPINHMLTVRRDLLEAEPDTVAELYRAFGARIEQRTATAPDPGPRVRALRFGITDELVAGLQVAIDYALQQNVIRTPVTVAELLGDFTRHLGGSA
ncbi:ABC transporter substrate-binding protein [Amycolatopsis ultiminotia]|uniref:ABC transporter substrate-binding protein n=1 Tax=Amycolatopsis ultiminotia TaxID=543629 RepID=A0ABP6V3G9_9PSEU